MLDQIVMPLDEKLLTHRQEIATLQNAGIVVPPKWMKLNRQLDDFLSLKSVAVNRLVESVVHPDPGDDKTILRGLAIAEAGCTPQAMATVTNAVVTAVHARMLEVIGAAAPDLYQRASSMFNETAQAFHDSCEICDPETSAQTVVGLEDAQRTAWQQSATLAARLGLLLPVVAVAASFGGVAGIDLDVDNHPVLIGLTVDTSGLHRRRVWECWTVKPDDGRTGRWGSLAALGATIRALPDLKQHQAYAEPKPLEHRREEFARGQYRDITVDPHDSDYRPEPIDPRRPQKKRVVIV